MSYVGIGASSSWMFSFQTSSLEFVINYFIVVTQGEKDDKIIAVCADDPEYKHFTDIKDLPPHRLTEIRRFFEDCILFQLKPYNSFVCLMKQHYILLPNVRKY